MKRWPCLLLIFAACVFAVAGCSRDLGKEHSAVRVKAEDFIVPPAGDELAEGLLKKPKKEGPPQDETPEAKKVREDAEKAKEAQEQEELKQRRLNQMKNIAKTYVTFINSGAADELSPEGLKLGLLRAGMRKERKAVEEKQIEVAYAADVNNKTHIIAYNAESDGGDNEVVFADQSFGRLKSEALKLRVAEQFMNTVGIWYKAYAAQEQERTLDGFKAFLNAKAPPAISKGVDSGEIVVNMQAQWGNGGQFLAYNKKTDNNLANGKQVAVMADGQTRFLEPAAVAQAFPGN